MKKLIIAGLIAVSASSAYAMSPPKHGMLQEFWTQVTDVTPYGSIYSGKTGYIATITPPHRSTTYRYYCDAVFNDNTGFWHTTKYRVNIANDDRDDMGKYHSFACNSKFIPNPVLEVYANGDRDWETASQ